MQVRYNQSLKELHVFPDTNQIRKMLYSKLNKTVSVFTKFMRNWEKDYLSQYLGEYLKKMISKQYIWIEDFIEQLDQAIQQTSLFKFEDKSLHLESMNSDIIISKVKTIDKNIKMLNELENIEVFKEIIILDIRYLKFNIQNQML